VLQLEADVRVVRYADSTWDQGSMLWSRFSAIFGEK
jgi:hypothetical protein